MTGARAHVSAVEHQILAESLRRVARVRPDVAMVLAEILDADEHELGRLACTYARRSDVRAQPGGRGDSRDGRVRLMPAERYKVRPQGLSPRQCGYVLNLVQGMSRRRAALAAGYSERCAGNVAHDVEGKRRGRFSMIRRFVQLVRASRPELLGMEPKGVPAVSTTPTDRTLEERGERQAPIYQRRASGKPVSARRQIAALEAKEKRLREAILRSGEFQP